MLVGQTNTTAQHEKSRKSAAYVIRAYLRNQYWRMPAPVARTTYAKKWKKKLPRSRQRCCFVKKYFFKTSFFFFSHRMVVIIYCRSSGFMHRWMHDYIEIHYLSFSAIRWVKPKLNQSCAPKNYSYLELMDCNKKRKKKKHIPKTWMFSFIFSKSNFHPLNMWAKAHTWFISLIRHWTLN